MLSTRITIDLPSAERDRPLGPAEWVRTLFGGNVDLRSGVEELTVSAWSLLQGLHHGFAVAGITDAVSLTVDGHPIYADNAAVPDDLDLLVHVARQSGVLERTFDEMRLVLCARRAGLHLLFETVVHRTVLLGRAELVVAVSARPEALARLPGETRDAFAARVADIGKHLAPWCGAFDALVADLAGELAQLLRGAALSVAPSHLWLEDSPVPTDELPFGAAQPTWRPVPQATGDGDPFTRYYDDPDWPLTEAILFDVCERVSG